MDIGFALGCLSKISKSEIHSTDHFLMRFNQRKNDMVPDVDYIHSRIINDNPVEISKQDDTKFKLKYELNDKYDMTIVISINNHNSISFNLITYMIQNSNTRKREEI